MNYSKHAAQALEIAIDLFITGIKFNDNDKRRKVIREQLDEVFSMADEEREGMKKEEAFAKFTHITNENPGKSVFDKIQEFIGRSEI